MNLLAAWKSANSYEVLLVRVFGRVYDMGYVGFEPLLHASPSCHITNLTSPSSTTPKTAMAYTHSLAYLSAFNGLDPDCTAPFPLPFPYFPLPLPQTGRPAGRIV